MICNINQIRHDHGSKLRIDFTQVWKNTSTGLKAHMKMILSLMNSSIAATLLNKVLTVTKYNNPYLQQN